MTLHTSEHRQTRGWWSLQDRPHRRPLLAAFALMAALLACSGPWAATVDARASKPAARAHGKRKRARKPARRHATVHRAQASPFAGRGMWIWYVSASNRGSIPSIAATAHRYGINTLLIKSGDGAGAWSQFNPQLVASLHAAGLRVCAWQYVYGNNPVAEAQVGAQAVRDGANCLVIDAESEYEGRYVRAQTYVRELRKRIGGTFPVALAGFPYVDYHPGFPYSVFLGPGGAQYELPQMYWVDIGTTVDAVYSHTYRYNRPYQRPIYPLGQIYNRPPPSQLLRFRQLSRTYGASGVSWWDWQEALSAAWRAIAQPVGNLSGVSPDSSMAALARGARGDLVVWAQEHLLSARQRLTVDGSFGAQTQAAVESFQAAHGLPARGVIDTSTWQALLRYAAAKVTWTTSGAQVARAARAARGARTFGPGQMLQVPSSAHLRARRYEIPRDIGAG